MLLIEKERATSGGTITPGIEAASLALAQALLAAERKGGVAGDDDDGETGKAPRGSKASTSAAGPEEPDLLPEFTQQTCYLQSDEQEHCVYEGTLCFDGHSPIVVVDKPIRSPERILDYTHSCSDFRYYEASALEISGCGYGYSSFRPYNASLPMQPATDFPLPLTRRRWGAQNRNGHLYFKEVTPEEVYGPPAPPAARAAAGFPAKSALHSRYARLLREAAYGGNPGVNLTWEQQAAAAADGGGGATHFSASGMYGAPVAQEGPFPHERVNGLNIARRTRVGNRTIDWIDGSLWLAGIDGQWWQNPYHWWTKMGALFDALRSNASASHPSDGYVHASYGPGVEGGDISTPGGAAIRRGSGQGTWNRAEWVVGPQWKLPPMDYVAFTGDGAINQATWVALLNNVTSLAPWFRATLTLATQVGSRLLFADLLQNLGDYHYVCTTRGGAIPGTKHKLFSSRSDAGMLRQYAYDVVGRSPPAPSASPSRLPKKVPPTPSPDPAVAAAAQRALVEERRATMAVAHPRHPPRKVTIIGRKGQNGRGIYNIDKVVAALSATGIPYEMVATMSSLSFETQVQLMAGTGLLIAPHGAHLQQLMFLPAHAAVIELWPFLMKKSTYRYLATTVSGSPTAAPAREAHGTVGGARAARIVRFTASPISHLLLAPTALSPPVAAGPALLPRVQLGPAAHDDAQHQAVLRRGAHERHVLLQQV